MDYRDYNNVDGLFLLITTINTLFGIENSKKNEISNKRDIRIESKLDKIMEMLGDKNELEGYWYIRLC